MRHGLDVVACWAGDKGTVIVGMIHGSDPRGTLVLPARLQSLGVKGIDLRTICITAIDQGLAFCVLADLFVTWIPCEGNIPFADKARWILSA